MPKIAPLRREDADAEQRRIGDPVFTERGHDYDGPFAVMLHDAELARRAEEFAGYVRGGAIMPKRLIELAILVTARHWSAQYTWTAHHMHAIANGMDEADVEAIRNGARPDFAREDEAVVHDYAAVLLANRGIAEDLHARAVAALGEKAVIGLVAIVGWYGSLSLIANAFDLDPLPDIPTLPG